MEKEQTCSGASSANKFGQRENPEHVSCGRRSTVSDCLPPLSRGQYPYLLTYDSEGKDNMDQIFYPIPGAYDLSNSRIENHHYHCRIPQLHERTIHGCFHGWLILSESKYSDSLEFCLWNPVTLNFIHLPCLILESSAGQTKLNNDIRCCCLLSPPENPDSILILTRREVASLVFCRLHDERKRWTVISYAEQLDNISNRQGDTIVRPIWCNGKVYAHTVFGRVIQIDFNHNNKNEEDAIILLPLVILPDSARHCHLETYLTASCNELFTIVMRLNNSGNFQFLQLFKLDLSTMQWEEMKSTEGRAFFVDAGDLSLVCCPATESESGSYIHIISDSCTLYLYNMEDKTISLASLPCPDLPPAMWTKYNCSTWVMPEIRLVGDHVEANHINDTTVEQAKEEEEIVVRKSLISSEQMGEKMKRTTEGFLLNLPLHILQLIAEHCVAVDYLNFRTTCKLCYQAASLIRWSSATALGRLQTHSLISPWLMMLDKDQGLITFTDPKFGDKYFMTTFSPDVSIGEAVIYSSKYGWLLIYRGSGSSGLGFFNPFTRAIVQLPPFHLYCPLLNLPICGFSAPPTSPDCIVVVTRPGLTLITSPGKSRWQNIHMEYYDTVSCLTFCGQDLYVLSTDGEIEIRRKGTGNYMEKHVVKLSIPSFKYDFQEFLVECGNDVLSIVVAMFGVGVEVFKLIQSTLEWEKVDSLGKYMIYACGTESFSVVAKIPEMENKIYFSRFSGGNIVFYSLDTCKYHTFGGEDEAFTDFFPTEEQLLSFWINPNWSS